MAKLKTFSPEHLAEEAEQSGFFQCKRCGLVWFGRGDIAQCPEGRHGRPVHVVVLCRTCDVVSLSKILQHILLSENTSSGLTLLQAAR